MHYANSFHYHHCNLGSLNGNLSSIPSHELGQNVIKALLDTTKVAPEDISEVILGQVLTCGQGQNPARQASINAGLPVNVPAMGVNMVCGSGLRSVALAAQSIRSGDASIIIAGNYLYRYGYPTLSDFQRTIIAANI